MGENRRFSQWFGDKRKTMKKHWLGEELEKRSSDFDESLENKDLDNSKNHEEAPQEVAENQSYENNDAKGSTIAVVQNILGFSKMVRVFGKLKEKNDFSEDGDDNDVSSSDKSQERSVFHDLKPATDSMEVTHFRPGTFIIRESSVSLNGSHSSVSSREGDEKIHLPWRNDMHEGYKHVAEDIQTVDNVYVKMGTETRMGREPPAKPKRLFLSDVHRSVMSSSRPTVPYYEENQPLNEQSIADVIAQENSEKIEPQRENITQGKVHQLIKKFSTSENVSAVPKYSGACGSHGTQEQIRKKMEQLMKLLQVQSEELSDEIIENYEGEIEQPDSDMDKLKVVDKFGRYVMQNTKCLPPEVMAELIAHIERAQEANEGRKQIERGPDGTFAPANKKTGKCLIQ